MTSQTRIQGISSILIAGLLLGAILIFYRFPAIPQHVSFDEIEFAQLALSLKDQPYTPYSPLATGHPTLYFYILLASIKQYGLSVFALRLPSAIFGVASIVMMFGFIYEICQLYQWGRRKSIIVLLAATLLFAGMRWQFNFARFAFEASFLLFLELTSLWMMIRFLRSHARLALALSGLAAGLAYNSYTPGRLFFFIPAILLIYEIFKYKPIGNNIKKLSAYIALFTIPFVMSILPLTLYLSSNTDIRYQQLAFFTNENLSYAKRLEFAGENLKSMGLMFFTKGDMNGRHNYPGKPALNPIVALCFLVGLIIIIRKPHFVEKVMFAYFFLSLIPTFLTYPWENPNMLRTITCIPAVVYIAARGIATITEVKMSRYMILAAVILLLTVSALYEARTYFVYQTQIFPHAFEYPQDQFEKRVKGVLPTKLQ